MSDWYNRMRDANGTMVAACRANVETPSLRNSSLERNRFLEIEANDRELTAG